MDQEREKLERDRGQAFEEIERAWVKKREALESSVFKKIESLEQQLDKALQQLDKKREKLEKRFQANREKIERSWEAQERKLEQEVDHLRNEREEGFLQRMRELEGCLCKERAQLKKVFQKKMEKALAPRKHRPTKKERRRLERSDKKAESLPPTRTAKPVGQPSRAGIQKKMRNLQMERRKLVRRLRALEKQRGEAKRSDESLR
jgi:hypothetical protein